MKKQAALELIDFLYASPTAFHSVLQTESYLMNHGYTELKETDSWSLQAKGKYYVKKNDSALIAFENSPSRKYNKTNTSACLDTCMRLICSIL